jgi:hypothetical protein
MAQNLTNYDSVLKEFYVDKIVEGIKQEMPLMEYAKKRDDMPTDGRRVVYPVHLSRNVGTGARAESANLPTAGNQTYQDIIIPYKYNHGRIQLSAQVMKQSKSSRGAFEKAFDAEIMGAAKDVGRARNRQLFGAGTGIIAVVAANVTSSTTVTLNNLFNIASGNSDRPAKFFLANQIVAFVTAGGTFDQVATISSVASNLQSIVLTAPVTLTAGEFVVTASTTADNSLGPTGYNNEIMGLLGQIDDGTYVNSYFNINRTTYPQMQSTRLSQNQGALTLDILQQLFDGVAQKGNGKLRTLVAHHTTRREYLNLLQTIKRYVNEKALNPDGGWKGAAIGDSGLEFNQVPWLEDRDCPYGIIFGVDDSYYFRYVIEEGKWADEDGTILLRLSGSDDYEARFRVFDNFVIDNPNTCGVIDGIKLSSTPEAIQTI